MAFKSRDQEKIIGDLLSIIKEQGYDGVHVNFEDVYYEDKELFNEFMANLYKAFHSNGLLVTVFVRIGDATYDPNLLAQVSDRIMIKAFDQHIEQGEAGSLASFSWIQDLIAQYKGPKEKLCINSS